MKNIRLASFAFVLAPLIGYLITRDALTALLWLLWVAPVAFVLSLIGLWLSGAGRRPREY